MNQDHAKKTILEFGSLMNKINDLNLMKDQRKYTSVCKKINAIKPIYEKYIEYEVIQKSIEELKQIISNSNEEKELINLAKEEINLLNANLSDIEYDINNLILSDYEDDYCDSIFLEIRAGAGGNEASLFASDLFKMYCRFSESQNWSIEIINSTENESWGFREIIAKINGKSVYTKLKFESGTHRVQRIPETESQGRIHTSTCTVAILPELDKIDDIEIDDKDIRFDTFRSSGAGGQHVNKTNSAVRLTHIPSGLSVECQEDRSQHRNKSKAMSLLKAKLLNSEIRKQEAELKESRRILIGSGDRSERIRTYNFPQDRVTDHRINLTLFNLNDILDGKIDKIIESLISHNRDNILKKIK